ncbi:50S ribosomal protein L32 [bacterium (Candidatus Howlettbacteria) CG_4_10_14_0_8_um_filter_40_9]|nr:MAG: 50S ribosomal protein L32 [bacterium (Candidatus Howlettbacteria) CG_4_10_14_0_8_um_filter_40_9]
MAVPKKKTSKSRTSSRKAANMKTPSITLTVCKKCGEKVMSHTICKVCGYYGGKKIIEIGD